MAAWRKLQAVAPSDAQRATPPWWAWVVAAAAIFALSLLGIRLTPPGSSVAAWWPAAGVAAFFILRTDRSRWWVVLLMVGVVTAVANTVAGRPLTNAAAFGIANAVEVGLFVLLLLPRGRSGRDLRVSTVNTVWRFVLSTFAASATLGVLVGLIIATRSPNPLEVAAYVTISHAAAILMIAPFAVLPPHIGQPTGWVEISFQILSLGGIVSYLIVAGNGLPLAFLPVAVLAWGAFRFPIRAAYAEALLVNLLILGATVVGVGPFGAANLPTNSAALLCMMFLLVTAINNIFLTAGSYELRANALAAKNVADLVTTGMVDSRIGLLVAEQRSDAWAVLLANTAARKILCRNIDDQMRWLPGPLLDAAKESISATRVVSIEVDDRVLNVDASLSSGGTPRISVQFVDITEAVHVTEERVAAETERAAATAARRELERRQVDFIATASHELRTPIASVTGYLELLEEIDDLAELPREWVYTAQRNAARLSYLIDDLLLLARAHDHAGSLDLNVAIPVSDLISDAMSGLLETAKARGVEISVGEVQGTVTGVRHELVRALQSLISNALKFAPGGTTVFVGAAFESHGFTREDGSSEQAIRIAVRDSGPGIAADDLPHVFDRFYRTPDAEIAQTAGVGLGLALARELVEANGGRIEVASPDRQGVVATLLLPVSPVPREPGS